MEHYLTTYTRDYVWPKHGAKVTSRKPGASGPSGTTPECLPCMHKDPPICECAHHTGGGGGGAGPDHEESGETGWSRNEVMGPLLDPKVFPARVGMAPEAPTSRYNQPNAFLDKLQSKFPMLYSILQNDPTSELKARIERDRNKTTYQVDYCESGPGAQFTNLTRAADVDGTGPCAAPLRLPGDPCRKQPRAPVSQAFTKSQGAGSGGERTTTDLKVTMPPMGKTEYQDGVSKVGGVIMRDKLHRRGR